MSLAERMRQAADTIEEISAFYGYRHPDEQGWSARELRTESQVVGAVGADYSGARANLGTEQ
jgi:hypothetical protein